MTDDLVGRPLWDAFCDLCNTHGPRGYGRDSKERIAFGADLNAFWQLVEADNQAAAARIEALEGENQKLREALAPFAKAGSIAGERSPYGDWYAYRPAAGDEYAIYGDHLRAAYAALTLEAPHAD